MPTAPEPIGIQVGGTVDPHRHVYIQREEDTQLLQLLLRDEYCNILSSRQVGKSSLINRTRAALAAHGYATVSVDVAGVLGSPTAGGDWYQGLLREITRQLRLAIDVRSWWAETDGTANQRFIAFFRDTVLPQLPGHLVVFLDEIDHTLNLPYTDDFFTAIRSMYNDRPRELVFARVSFCLSGVVAPNELIKTMRTTAYNVGRTLELTDFDAAKHDLMALARLLSPDANEGKRILDTILSWTGGHPYLTARLCDHFAMHPASRSQDVDAFVRDRYERLEQLASDVHFQQVTRFLAERLADGRASLELYERLLEGHVEADKTTIHHTQLKLSGLAKRDASGTLVVRNRIYAQVFDLEWVRQSLPERAATAMLSRRTTVYRRVAIASATIVAALVLGAWLLVRSAPNYDDVIRVTFPEYEMLPDDTRRLLDAGTVEGFASTGAQLWDELSSLQRATLLNVTTAAVYSVPDRQLIAYVERLLAIRTDRVRAYVNPQLRDVLESAVPSGMFFETDVGLSEAPEGFTAAGSYRDPSRYASLHVTLFTATREGGSTIVVAEIDVDAGTYLTQWDLTQWDLTQWDLTRWEMMLRNFVTGELAHPYYIRDLLIRHSNLDPGYDVVRKQAQPP